MIAKVVTLKEEKKSDNPKYGHIYADPKIEYETATSGKKVIHKGWADNDIRQKWLQYLYDNVGEDGMRTFLAENPSMGITTKSNMVGANGHSDYGICQINTGYHPEIIRGEGYSHGSGKFFVEWFYDPYNQMDHCIKKFKDGTKFYAFKHRFSRTKQIIIL